MKEIFIKLEQIVLWAALKVSQIEQEWQNPIVTLLLMEIENYCKQNNQGHCSVIYFFKFYEDKYKFNFSVY